MMKKYVMNCGQKMKVVLIQRVNLVMIVIVRVMVFKFLSGNKQSDSYDDKHNVNDDSDMQHETWTKVGAKQSHFPFSGKPGLNVDLEDPNNPLEYFELFITPTLAELISRETSQYAEQFLEDMPNLKIRSRVHHWNNANREEIMKLLTFLLLQGIDQIMTT
jgi:hypothetical protein